MDNRTIDEVRKNETKLINEIKVLETEIQKYKKVINKLKKCINDFPAIHYSSIEKVNIKRLNVILIPVDELLDILKEVPK